MWVAEASVLYVQSMWLLAQFVRALVFVAAVFIMIPGVANLFDIDAANNTEAIFMVLIGALLAVAMGTSFWTARRDRRGRDPRSNRT